MNLMYLKKYEGNLKNLIGKTCIFCNKMLSFLGTIFEHIDKERMTGI